MLSTGKIVTVNSSYAKRVEVTKKKNSVVGRIA
jgi:hypothetical protein